MLTCEFSALFVPRYAGSFCGVSRYDVLLPGCRNLGPASNRRNCAFERGCGLRDMHGRAACFVLIERGKCWCAQMLSGAWQVQFVDDTDETGVTPDRPIPIKYVFRQPEDDTS